MAQEYIYIQAPGFPEMYKAPVGTPIPPGYEIAKTDPVYGTVNSPDFANEMYAMLDDIGVGQTSTLPSTVTDPALSEPRGLLNPNDITRYGPGTVGGIAGSALGGIPGAMLGSGVGELLGQAAAGQPTDLTRAGLAAGLGGIGGVVGRGVEMGTRMLGHGIKSLKGTVMGSLDDSPVALTGFQQALNAAQKDFGRVGQYSKGDAATTPTNAVLAQLNELQNVMGQVNASAVPLKTADMLRQTVGGYFDVNKAAALPGKVRGQLYAALMNDLRAASGSNPQVGPYLDDLANSYIARGVVPTGGLERLGTGAAGLGSAALLAAQNPMAAAGPMGALLAYLMGKGLYRTPIGLAEPMAVGVTQAGANPYLP